MTIRKNICVVTGSRAEYGLLFPLLQVMQATKHFEIRLVVTGTHLSKKHGLTVESIRSDGFIVAGEVDLLLEDDSTTGICKAMGVGIIGFANAYKELKPNLLVLLGDRYELLSAAAAALISKIPIAHIHGGEVTEGAYDDGIRHSITKMSYLHFTSTERYRLRVVQMGEHPDRTFNVGALGVDNISRLRILSEDEVERFLGCSLAKKNILVTFHPETLAENEEEGLPQLLEVLSTRRDIRVIFTGVNADTRAHKIDHLIREFVSNNGERTSFHSSLGYKKYLSTMRYMSAVVGNSSSGLIEAPSMNVATINIGQRQKGRVRADSVLDCEANVPSISAAFDKLEDPNFIAKVKQTVNPHGKSGASSRILKELIRTQLDWQPKKTFYDLSKSLN
jgi:GDP/UDP-N,N'-diacetylbacillosamine 2-epimerase (hydrolysing)